MIIWATPEMAERIFAARSHLDATDREAETVLARRRDPTMRVAAALPKTALVALCVSTAGSITAHPPSASVPPGLYALTTETLLPHLEEALRYATVKTTRCVAGDAAESFFPLLQHDALSGCSLMAAERPDTFTLSCRNPEAATGMATFERSASGMRATLQLKMGAKNMTLSQRVVGSRLGDCK